MATYTVENIKIVDLKTRLDAMDTATRTFVALIPRTATTVTLVSKA